MTYREAALRQALRRGERVTNAYWTAGPGWDVGDLIEYGLAEFRWSSAGRALMNKSDVVLNIGKERLRPGEGMLWRAAEEYR